MMMNTFSEIAVGESFESGDNWYRKHSSKTAIMTHSRMHDGKRYVLTEPSAPPRAFYFGQRDRVNHMPARVWYENTLESVA